MRFFLILMAAWLWIAPLAAQTTAPGIPPHYGIEAGHQFPPQSGGGTVTIDNSANVHNTAGGTQSVSISGFTVGTGANRAILVEIVSAGAFTTDTITCTWNPGAAQSFPTTPVSISTSEKTVVMGLVNPTSGTGSVTCSWNVTFQADMYMEAISFTGVNQTTPFSAATSTTGTGTAVSISVPVASANDMAVDVGHNTGNDSLTAPTQTAIWNLAYGGSSHGTGASSVSFAWTAQFAGDTWEELGIDVKH